MALDRFERWLLVVLVALLLLGCISAALSDGRFYEEEWSHVDQTLG